MEAYIGLGTNMGDRDALLREALARIGAEPGLSVARISPVYETAPVGYTDQPAFLNMAVRVNTELDALTLLRRLLAIEREMGRVREVRWGPRNIDLDLLVADGAAMETPELTLPHPRMEERAFVLVPLRDVWPEDRPFPWARQLAAFDWEAEGIVRRAES